MELAMNFSQQRSFFASAAAIAFMGLGCAAPSSEEASDVVAAHQEDDAVQEETVGTSHQSLTSTTMESLSYVTGQHITVYRDRNYQLKNAARLKCLQRNGVEVDLAACSTSSTQKFTIFEHHDAVLLRGYADSYTLCQPDTVAFETVNICTGGGCNNVPGYTANCVVATPVTANLKTGYAFKKAILAFKLLGDTKYTVTLGDFDSIPDTVRTNNVFMKISDFSGKVPRPGYMYATLVDVAPSYPTGAPNVGNNWAPMSWSLL